MLLSKQLSNHYTLLPFYLKLCVDGHVNIYKCIYTYRHVYYSHIYTCVLFIHIYVFVHTRVQMFVHMHVEAIPKP